MYWHTLLESLSQNAPLVTLWIIILQVILLLCVFWLSRRIAMTSPGRALQVAKENQQTINAAKAKIDSLDTYIRESFSKEFSGSMQSFDDTVSSVLNQMKDELTQGVQRIEQIEVAVAKKNILEHRVNQGQEGVTKLIATPDEKLVDAEDQKAPEEAAAQSRA